MTHKHRKLPEPTTEELEAEKNHWIGLNPFWWSIMQGWIANLRNPIHWVQYTQEIDQGIIDIMTDDLVFAGAKIYLSSNQSLASATGLTVPLDTSVYVENMTFSGGKLIVVREGYYHVTGQAAVSTGGGFRAANILINQVTGATLRYGQSGIAQAVITNAINVSWQGHLSVDDEIELFTVHQSSGSINVLGGVANTWLAAYRMLP